MKKNDPDLKVPGDWDIDDYNQTKFLIAHMTVGCGCIFALLIVFLLCLCLCGCTTTKVVTVEKIRTDTTYISKLQRDSVWLHDSVFVKSVGDTLWFEKWHTKYIEKQIHDTLVQATHDTIPIISEVEVIKEVPAELSFWQKLLIDIGAFACLVAIFAFGTWVWKTK